jgi:hypothetical protein
MNSQWILEHATIRNGKIYRHEYRERDDGSREWRNKTVIVKKDDSVRPWDIEMDLAMEAMR